MVSSSLPVCWYLSGSFSLSCGVLVTALALRRSPSRALPSSWTPCARGRYPSQSGVGSKVSLSWWGCSPGRSWLSARMKRLAIARRLRPLMRWSPGRQPPLLAGLRLQWSRRRHRKSRSPRGTLLLPRRRFLCLRFRLRLLPFRPVTDCEIVLGRRPARLLPRRLLGLLCFLLGLRLFTLWSRSLPCRTCFAAGLRLLAFPPRLPLGPSRLPSSHPGVRIVRLVSGYPVAPQCVCPFFDFFVANGPPLPLVQDVSSPQAEVCSGFSRSGLRPLWEVWSGLLVRFLGQFVGCVLYAVLEAFAGWGSCAVVFSFQTGSSVAGWGVSGGYSPFAGAFVARWYGFARGAAFRPPLRPP